MKRIISVFLFICILLTLSGCKKEVGGPGNFNGKNYIVPENLLTTEQYHAELKKLLETENFTTADEAYLNNLDALGDRVRDMLYYSEGEELTCTGTKYYISNNGNDANDGKSPETAWATIGKAKSAPLKAGDMICLERGSMWREKLKGINGVTYTAYGEGPKPAIYDSVDLTEGTWTPTDTENIWVYSEKLSAKDFGAIVFNYGLDDVTFGNKEESKAKLRDNLDFVFTGQYAKDRPIDRKIYLKCEGGNPGDIFESIELINVGELMTSTKDIHDITLNNIHFFGGENHYFNTNPKNITISYCYFEWQGGSYFGTENNKAGGGGGAWFSCENLVYDHCYFNQQFDCALSPQFSGDADTPGVFNGFKVTNCMFENCEYGLEYFTTQNNTTENRIENMYFAYNFCRKGGEGFGDKPSNSAYIKSWGHENTCKNCLFEYNVFDRAAAATLEIISYEQAPTGKTYTYEFIPKLQNNIYIQKKDKKFAIINDKTYKFNEAAYDGMKQTGMDKNSVFVYVSE